MSGSSIGWLGSPLHIESSLPCVLWLSPDPEDCEKALPGEAACTLDESLRGTLHRQVPKHTDCQTPVIHAELFFKAQKIFLHTATLTKVCDVVCSCVWRSSMWLSVLTVIFFFFFCSVFPSSCVSHSLHFSPCLLSHSHSLPLLLSLHSSPSFTSWLCSRAPSPSHQATRDSLVRSTTWATACRCSTLLTRLLRSTIGLLAYWLFCFFKCLKKTRKASSFESTDESEKPHWPTSAD